MFDFRTVSFSIHLAAAFLEIAIRRTAEMHKAIDPVASQRIQNDRYVDDLSISGSPGEVHQFVGDEHEDFKCNGTIPSILAQTSLR